MAGPDPGDIKNLFGGGGFTASFAQSVWDSISRGERILFSERAGSVEEALQRAADRGGLRSVEDVVRFIHDFGYAKAAPGRAAALNEGRELLGELPAGAGERAFALPLPESAAVGAALPPDLPGSPPLLAAPPVPEESSTAHPSAIPMPVAGVTDLEFRDLAKLAGGRAEGEALLKLLQAQGAVAGPAAGPGPFAPLPLPTPPAPAPLLPMPPVPGPPPATSGPAGVPPAPGSLGPARERGTPPAVAWRELAGLAEGPLVGPAGNVDPGGAAPARGNIPWDVLAGLGHETSEKLPWDVVVGLAEGPSAEELAREADRKTEAARTPARVSPFRHPLQYLAQAGQRFVEETLGFDLGLGGDEPPGSEAAQPGPLAGIPRAPAFGAGPGEAASAEPAGGGGASLVPLLERIAAGVERLVEIVGQGGAGDSGAVRFPRPDFGSPGPDWADEDDPFTPASPSVDVEDLDRPGQDWDAYARPRREAPKRQPKRHDEPGRGVG